MLSLVAGPIPAGEYTTLPVALQPSSFTIYLGANRGRGQREVMLGGYTFSRLPCRLSLRAFSFHRRP